MTDFTADYHHDLRPWEACTRKDIRAGDLVATQCGDSLRIAIARYQDVHGDWRTEGHGWLTYGDDWTLRRIPSATSEKDTTLTDPFHDARPWEACTRKDIRKGDLVETRTADRLRIGVAHHQDGRGNWHTVGDWLLTYNDHWSLRRIPSPTPPAEEETALTETTPAVVPSEPLARTILGVPEGHGAPHHDADRINAGDYVVEMDYYGDILYGRALRKNEDGDWMTEEGGNVTAAAILADHPDALTVWPAPTPPAEEVELSTEHPAHLLDVVAANGDVCAHMALDRDGYWLGVSMYGMRVSLDLHRITAFTLPDGTRARRDGNRPDGTPRFVKEDSK